MLVIRNHRLETVIAHGVTSEIWSAVRLGPGGFAQSVALKTLAPQFAAMPTHVRTFLNEARAAAHVHHPQVVQTHEVIEEDGRYWLSMELVRGWTLRALIATLRLTRRAMPLEVAVALIRDAAAGVHAIHEAGLLHRHITPDNLMASAAGHAVVLDFGCASWQLAEQVRFTAPIGEIEPPYASPQINAQQRVDARTDVYSLGAVLHELIAGDPPPTARGPRQIIVAPSSWRPDLPPALEGIIARAVEPEPMVRFASCLELSQALELVAIQHRWAITPSHVVAYLGEVFRGQEEIEPPRRRPPEPRQRIEETPAAGVSISHTSSSRSPARGPAWGRQDSVGTVTTEHETNPFVRAVPAAPATTRAAPPPVPVRSARPTPRPAPPPMPARAAPTAPRRPIASAPAPRPVAPLLRPTAPVSARHDLANGSGARRMAAHEAGGDDDDPDPDAGTNPRNATLLGKTRVRVRRR